MYYNLIVQFWSMISLADLSDSYALCSSGSTTYISILYVHR